MGRTRQRVSESAVRVQKSDVPRKVTNAEAPSSAAAAVAAAPSAQASEAATSPDTSADSTISSACTLSHNTRIMCDFFKEPEKEDITMVVPVDLKEVMNRMYGLLDTRKSEGMKKALLFERVQSFSSDDMFNPTITKDMLKAALRRGESKKVFACFGQMVILTAYAKDLEDRRERAVKARQEAEKRAKSSPPANPAEAAEGAASALAGEGAAATAPESTGAASADAAAAAPAAPAVKVAKKRGRPKTKNLPAPVIQNFLPATTAVAATSAATGDAKTAEAASTAPAEASSSAAAAEPSAAPAVADDKDVPMGLGVPPPSLISV